MKKLLLTTAILALSGLQQPALAHGDEKHEGHHSTSSTGSASTEMKSEDALKILHEGIALMEETVSDKNREEMFANGPIMDKWHDKESAIREAAESLKKNPSSVSGDKKKRLESSINQLNKVLDDFHIATHNQDAAKAQAEVKKAKGALKLIEANIK